MNHCPHCRTPLPSKLRWTTFFAGQTAHTCPQCRKRFRLTYGAKRRLAVLNLILILGFIVLWFFPDVPRNLLVYMVVALVALALMPTQARYEILSRHYDVPGGPSEAQRARRAPPARKPKSPTRRKA